jgi:hypothetical protein
MTTDKVNNAVLALYPGQIDGATTNVISDPTPPPDVPVQGVPLNLFLPVLNLNGVLAGAVKLRIDPPPVDSSDDINAISFWLNGIEIQSTTVTPENRNKQFLFDVFQTDLLDNVVNKILYKVHRPSGNTGTSTELWVLYSDTLPGGNDVPEDDGDEHPDLELNFPPELGDPPRIGKDEVEKGVALTVDYPYTKAYDRITLEIRRERFSFTVKPADVGKPVPLFIDPDKFQLVGSLDACPFSYTVVDQLLNATHKRRWSKISRADINLTQLILDKAILREVIDDDMDVPEIVDLDKILGDSLLVVVPPKAGIHKKGDEVVAMYQATQPDAQWELNGIFEENFGVLLPCVMKLEKSKVVSGSKIQVTYQLKRNGEVIGDSRVAKADVIGGTVGDDKPVISLITGSPSGEEIPDGSDTVETAVTLTGVAKKGEKVEVFSGQVSHGKPDVDGVTGLWTLLIPALDETTYVFVAKELYGAGQSSDAYTINVVSMQPPVLLAPAVNPIDVLAYEQGVTLRVAFAQALPGQQAQLKERDPLPGSEPFPVVTLDPNSQADFPLDSAFLVARRGTSRRFYWTLISGGKPVGDSPDLTLVINSIAKNDPRLPTPNIAGETGVVLETNELESNARILSAKWPLQKPGQPLWITCEGSDKNGNPVTEVVRSGEPNDSTTGLSVTAPVDWLKALKDGTDLRVKCAFSLDGGTDGNAAVPLLLRTYKISAFVEVRPAITGVKDSIRENIAEGGTTADFAVTLSGTASAGQNIQLYDGASTIGPVIKAQTNGDWSQIIDELTLKTYSFTAVAKYGSGLVSAPPRTFRVIDYVEENFEDLPLGPASETPVMFIAGTVKITGNFPFVAPQGQALTTDTTFYADQSCNMKFKGTYRKVTFLMHSSYRKGGGDIRIYRGNTLIKTQAHQYHMGDITEKYELSDAVGIDRIEINWRLIGTVATSQIDDVRLYK